MNVSDLSEKQVQQALQELQN
jgi:chromosome segregation ATPase